MSNLTAADQPRPRRRFTIGQFFKWLAILLVVVILSIAAFIVFLPEAWLRSVAGGKATDAVGREFAIDGPLKIRWHWDHAQVTARDIRLANVSDSKDKNMVEIKSLDFSIKFWELLYGKLNFPELNIDGARIVLEKKDEKTKNWDFPALSKANTATEATLPDDRGEFPVLGAFKVTNSTLVYRDAPKKLDVELALDTSLANADDDKSTMSISGKGTIQDQSFTLDAKGGGVNMLRNTDKPFPLKLDLTMGKTEIHVDGTFQDPVKMAGVDTSLKISGPNLADLFYLTTIVLPPSPPYSLSGRLTKKGDVWHYNDFAGKVGDSNLDGDLSYDISGERGFLKADLTSKLLDIKDLGGFIGAAPKNGSAKELSAEQKEQVAEAATSPNVLPDVPIDLARLRTMDADVKLKATRVNAPNLPIDDLLLGIRLDNGLLKVDPLKMGLAKGDVGGVVILNGREQTPSVDIDVTMTKLNFREFFDGTRFEPLSGGRFGGHFVVKGSGKSLAEVLGSGDGRFTAVMTGGRISRLIAEAVGLDIAQVAPRLLGADESTEIRCGVVDFGLKDGLLRSNAIVLDTTFSNIHGDGVIDLKDESVSADIQSDPKQPSVLSGNTPITIGGRLKKPAIGLEPVEATAKVGAATALGVVLTPIAAIIPFIDIGLGEDADCDALIATANERIQEKQAKP